MDAVQRLIDQARNWLKPTDEDSEPQAPEEPMTRGELIRTIIGLLVIDALFTFGFRYWADHDPRIASPFSYWFMIPMISVLAVGMAALQVYWYRHPDEQADEEEESNA